MTYYAHTAEDDDGNRLPKSKWQPLKDHHLLPTSEWAAALVQSTAS